MNIRVITALIACAAAALSACDSAQSDWNRATAANTLAAYQSFVQKHGDDKRADNARGRILALQDDQAWIAAQAANSIAGYQAYLSTESGGIHAREAQYQLTALQRAHDWQAAAKNGSAAALQAFLLKYPQGQEADQARTMLQADNRVQLADAHGRTDAERKHAR